MVELIKIYFFMKIKQGVIIVLWMMSAGISSRADSSAPDTATGSVVSTNLSQGLQQLVNLAVSGVSQQTLISYINTYPQPFNANTESILYLRDQGISNEIIDAVLNHEKGIATPLPPAQTQTNLNSGVKPYNYAQKAYGTNPYVVTPAPTVPQPVVTEQPMPPQQPPEVVATQPAPAPVYVTDASEDVTYFYNQLQPYGTWVNLSGYGWCWQPRAVVLNPGWRPYCDGGHWVYSDSGWCWNSDYGWGWAPFHYGRWHLHPGVGWVWFPDRVWGPGWVTWRNDSIHCGWAPLPPRCEFIAGNGYRYNGVRVGLDFDFGLGLDAFTFITFGNFAERDYHRCRLEREECRGFFPRTTVVNNFSYDRNHGVINRGFDRRKIETASHHTFTKFEVKDEHREGGISHSYGGNVIYKQQPAREESHAAITAQRLDNVHTHIDQHTDFTPNTRDMGGNREIRQQQPVPMTAPQPPIRRSVTQQNQEGQGQFRQHISQQPHASHLEESRPSVPTVPVVPNNVPVVTEHSQVGNRNPVNMVRPQPVSTPVTVTQPPPVVNRPVIQIHQAPVVPPSIQSQPTAPPSMPARQIIAPMAPAHGSPGFSSGAAIINSQPTPVPVQTPPHHFHEDSGHATAPSLPPQSTPPAGNNSGNRQNHGNQNPDDKSNHNPH